jgi:hypothetical protein
MGIPDKDFRRHLAGVPNTASPDAPVANCHIP